MLTVLVATRNGAKTLPAVLETYSRLEIPKGGWKLVVVDNASTDMTGDIVKSFRDRLPVTYVLELQDGKNAALNTGLGLVSGDLVVFSDDDAFPRADWLVRLREAADANPAFSIFGGVVIPRWETQPPAWILTTVPLGPAFALSDLRLEEGPMAHWHAFGPNMAIRAAVFQAGHRFDTTIGPRRSGNYPMGSESELVRRLTRLGLKTWHVHSAVVEHFVRATQLRRRWLINRARRFGRGQYRLDQKQVTQIPPCWWGVPRHLFRKMAGTIRSMLSAALREDASRLFQSRWEFNVLCGRMVEARLMNKERRTPSESGLSFPDARS